MTNQDEVLVTVSRTQTWRHVSTGATLLVVGALIVYGKDRPLVGALLVTVVGVGATLVFALTIKPVTRPLLKINDECVFLYQSSARHARLIPWEILSGVEFQKGSSSAEARSRDWLVFRLMALEWKFPADEIPEAGRIVSVIRSRILPAVAAKTETLDAPAFFETVFGIRLPVTAKVVHAEFHPADKSGLWSVRITKDEFLKLKISAGAVSEWYPLTPDQRFEVGGRRLAGTSDINGEYAISRQDWDSTPVLVRDAGAGLLHGILTRSVG